MVVGPEGVVEAGVPPLVGAHDVVGGRARGHQEEDHGGGDLR